MSQHHNVNASEVEKFDRLAEDWWDANGPMKPLHLMNPVRLGFIQQSTTLTDQKVLDIGCGAGLLSEAMAKQGAEVTGLDMAEQALAAAKAHSNTQQLTINYIQSSAEDFAEQHPNTFDTITCMELLEHVPNPASLIKACATLVKPNGKVFFSTINRTLSAFVTTIIGAEYILRWLPKGTHHYREFIKPAELNHWAEAEGLQLRSLKGMKYHFSSESFSLEQNVSSNYITCFEKIASD